MTLNEFYNLGKEARYQAMWEKAVVVAERGDLDCKYHLYQIDGFYVELGYDYVLNRVISLMIFDDMDMLYPYLLQIDVESLIN